LRRRTRRSNMQISAAKVPLYKWASSNTTERKQRPKKGASCGRHSGGSPSANRFEPAKSTLVWILRPEEVSSRRRTLESFFHRLDLTKPPSTSSLHALLT